MHRVTNLMTPDKKNRFPSSEVSKMSWEFMNVYLFVK
jgi:hypothetical protein